MKSGILCLALSSVKNSAGSATLLITIGHAYDPFFCLTTLDPCASIAASKKSKTTTQQPLPFPKRTPRERIGTVAPSREKHSVVPSTDAVHARRSDALFCA
jgi:hypothetical protein